MLLCRTATVSLLLPVIMRFPFSGVLPVDKPAGVSSRRVVDAVAKALAMRAVGHAGTLDPIAAGVVVVCVGHATKLVDFLHTLPKRYVGHFLLGRSSPSDDTELPVVLEESPVQPTREQLEAAVAALRGPIMQRPCTFSAVHVDGKRAYDLARRGRDVQLQPKEVTIHRLEVLAYAWPRLILEVECSTGTYIRAIGRDLAEALGTRGVMDGLSRKAVGPFEQEDALPLDRLLANDAGTVTAASLRPASAAVSYLPAATLNTELVEHISRGGILPPAVVPANASHQDAVAAFDQHGVLVGILRPHRSGWRVRPNFVGLN
jgi:tRNA pseudouridine55 synthase